MKSTRHLKAILLGSAFGAGIATGACAERFDIPAGDLNAALSAYASTTGTQLVVSSDAVRGIKTRGVSGDFSDDEALSRILSGTGFIVRHKPGTSIIVREQSSSANDTIQDIQMAQAAPARAAVETVTVTSSKLGGADVQSIPISITALSQEQLTSTQTAGGPDLIKQVPNMTFTKTNFSGYSIQLRGIGTQAISVTTDPAVAVALNDIPFIRNHFFEQEFYDVGQVEVLRGPQGTLYGRNATAGVVNLISAKPTDQFEAMASADFGNYHERRLEGMINIPIVDDRFDVRLAGEWTKRQGYSFNEVTNDRIDGRDLWSGRLSIAFKPVENLQMNLVWEHFSENDDRLRSSKQLCKNDPTPESVNGIPVVIDHRGYGNVYNSGSYLSQGCLPTSMYSADAFQVPNGYTIPYFTAAGFSGDIDPVLDPYATTVQSRNLRVIQSALNPQYKAKNDTVELNADYNITPTLTFTSQTGFNNDFLWSTEDYNRFNTQPGVFIYCAPGSRRATCSPQPRGEIIPDTVNNYTCIDGTISYGGNFCATPIKAVPWGIFCDPQLGCSDRAVAEDISAEHAWQLSQEFRWASHFSGPFNFSVGGNYLHYETEENYYVFANTLTLFTLKSFEGAAIATQMPPYVAGVSDNHECLRTRGYGYSYLNPATHITVPSETQCEYIDPNPLESVNNEGHNYFLSQNPYALNSYALFGETYYNILSDLKLTTGLRWTEDKKHFTNIPSEVLVDGWGYPTTGVVNQRWDQFTGKAVLNWTPRLDFTDQTLIYGSYSHGYKAGGANPPSAVFISSASRYGGGVQGLSVTHPLTFKPEFVDAFELGTKNTLLDGALTLNGDIFYYNYENYQISQIVDRTSINLNFDAHVKGAEVEATWEPVPGLRFNFSGGYEKTSLAKGSNAIDLMDRTAGQPGWMVVKPLVTHASNCILPTSVISALEDTNNIYIDTVIFGQPIHYHVGASPGWYISEACAVAYSAHLDPVTLLPYVPNPTVICKDNSTWCPPGFGPAGYAGFDPSTAPNNGEGFSKDLSGKELPNAPPLTASFGAQYTLPITQDWAGTLRADYYWQDYSWARVFNDNPYDRIRGYQTVNLTLILTNQNGWQVMLYDKNVFNETAITGAFLNSDDSGLTTNVFLTDPKLIGIRVTKNW